MAKTITSTSLTSDVYAFVFGQQGLMGGVGLQDDSHAGRRVDTAHDVVGRISCERTRVVQQAFAFEDGQEAMRRRSWRARPLRPRRRVE